VFDAKTSAKIAYCGLYCPLCSFKAASETKDRQHLLAMPQHYAHLKEQSFEECACPGCKVQTDHCECRFGIKPCAEARGLLSCADCAEFPCEKINAFGHDGTPHHEDGLRNLQRIREVDYAVWLQEMDDLMYCRDGTRRSWYYRKGCSATILEDNK
jgi:hypothetical protein